MYCAYHIITSIDVEKLLPQDESTSRNTEQWRTPRGGKPSAGSGRLDRQLHTPQRRCEPYPRRLATTLDGGESEESIAGSIATNTFYDGTEEEAIQSEFTTSADEETAIRIQTGNATRDEGSTEESEGHDTLDCSMGERKFNNVRIKLSPWKVIAYHTGTRRPHYHIIYISTAKNWGHNSKLGKAIRSKEHKCTQIACIQCLLEYITTGPDRTTLKQILTERDKKVAMCVAHSLGLNPKQTKNHSRNPEGGNNLFRNESATRNTIHGQMDQHSIAPDQIIFENADDNEQFINQCPGSENDTGSEQSTLSKSRGFNNSNRHTKLIRENQELVLFLCKNKAFDEGEATRLLCNTPEGITIQFNRNFGERLSTALRIARTLVFQESHEQRLQRAKQYELQQDPLANDPKIIEKGIDNLVKLLENNGINVYKFAKLTRHHFYGLTEKRNNLFFLGPPSSGKTMIMESLVNMHYNFTRLTGLTPTSSFNFASLIHTNACFMDECKLTDNQFEQWKLLAARQPMSTDVKYKTRQDIKNCILYTASNYPICAYVSTTDAKEAVETRTITFYFTGPTKYFKLNPFIWETFWKIYSNMEESNNAFLLDFFS